MPSSVGWLPAAAADRRQPQKQQHKKKKAAGSCCCWLLLLWWVGLRCARQCALRGAAAGLLEHRINNTAAQQKSCFFGGWGLRFRSPLAMGGGPPDFRASDFRASDFRASDCSGFGLLGCFCRHGGFCRRCCCHQPGQPTRAGTVDFAAAAAGALEPGHKCFTWNNPDSRPVPERRILPLLLPSTRTADPCRNGGFFLYLTFHFSIIVNFFN